MKTLWILSATSFLTACATTTPTPGADDDPALTQDAPITRSCEPGRLRWGVNVHDGGRTPSKLAEVMNARHLTTARMDLWGNDDAYLEPFRDAVTSLAARGVSAEAIVSDRYSKGQPQWEDCSSDLAMVERNAYEDTLPQIRKTEDLVHDFELQNEVSLYENIRNPGTTGERASDFDNTCGRMQAANLRGMARAVTTERARTGLPLRILLGTTDRAFGFLAFMRQQNVPFEVIGYHIYPWEDHAPLDEDPWYGPGGPLGQLAQFDLPIHVNEYNCGETYGGTGDNAHDPPYENEPGKPATEACLRSMAKHLLEIVRQRVAPIESVHFYEMWDEQEKPAPENRFGLMYDLNRPKVHLCLAAAFAGGQLARAESAALTQRGLLTAEQIADWSPCGAAP